MQLHINWSTHGADYNNIGKFLNRILGMEVHQQNALFQYFSDTLAAVIQEAKRNGRYDMGILGKTVFICSVHGESQHEMVISVSPL